MSDTVIKVENLSKQYRIGAKEGYKTFRETLVDAVRTPFQGISKLLTRNSKLETRNSKDTIWALKNVSFDVKRGEVVGIIGRNGAGKSTLLKILSKITEPTEGRVELSGRVGSLLEVGTGFHPELTGHENIYLYGAILGMDRWEISRKFNEIVAFAELEKFIDTPVKRYSSGMYMRLAFSVAAHLEPEILLIDEVLAVGDVSFQKKCLGKMDGIAKQGRTVLFVSHNMPAVRLLCTSGMLIDSGQLSYSGTAENCIDMYLDSTPDRMKSICDHILRKNPNIDIFSIMVNDSKDDCLTLLSAANTLKIEIQGRIATPMRLDIEARIYDKHETPLAFFSPGHEKGITARNEEGNFRLRRFMELPKMNRGEFYLYLYVTDPGKAGLAEIPRAVKLITSGTATATGHVFDYDKGAGFIFLPEITHHKND